MYDLDYIILQHSNTHFFQPSENTYFYQVIFNIFSVRAGQNLVFSQKEFAHQRLNKGYIFELLHIQN